MELTTVDAYGAPAYGALGRPPAGLVLHTPEWGTNPALSMAIDCARWQGTSGNTSGGSYHGILGHDDARFPHPVAQCEDPMHWVMVRSVPWDRAAGGLIGNHTPPPGGVWAPDRFEFLRRLLPAAAFADPNRWLHQISWGGTAAWYLNNGFPRGLLIATAWWIMTLERIYQYDSLLTLHRYWQTNRTDPGPVGIENAVLDEYFKLINPPVPEPTPQLPQTFTDVPPSHWAYTSIEWGVANGVISPNPNFRPEDRATRAETMAMLHRLANSIKGE